MVFAGCFGAILATWSWTSLEGIQLLEKHYHELFVKSLMVSESDDVREYSAEIDTTGLFEEAMTPCPFIITFQSNEMHLTPGLTSERRVRKTYFCFFGYLRELQ